MKHRNIDDLPRKHRSGAEGYEFYRRDLLAVHEAQSLVRVYEIPPGKSAYPYHYHLKNEETFFILKGEGLLRSAEGARAVKAGDLLFFPAGEEGVHKLTNTSETEMLVYLDFDVVHDLDVAVYPDSGKLGIWGKDVNKTYRIGDDVDYYEDE
ncbi:MAG: cupin domain-containing protein [Oscillospiraceae bacterium]|nr:cupin domain-containing protein [Oscillospiraceae bacterium]